MATQLLRLTPLCKKHGLLRWLPKETVVSSQALYDALGGELYAEFIEFNNERVDGKRRGQHVRPQSEVGFHPETVEEFLRTECEEE